MLAVSVQSVYAVPLTVSVTPVGTITFALSVIVKLFRSEVPSGCSGGVSCYGVSAVSVASDTQDVVRERFAVQ